MGQRPFKPRGGTSMCRLAVLALVAAALCPPVFAAPADYPTKPIRLLVASGTGGGLDFVARLIGPALTEDLGQSIIIDNRPGAGGDIAVELAARAAADGYTLVFLSASTVVRAALYETRYDLFKDFTPVSEVTAGPYVLIAYPGLAVKNVSDLIAYAKANPGKLNYSSTGNGTLIHLAGEYFKVTSGIDVVHVPYKGVGAAMPELLAGRIQFTFTSLAPVLPLVRGNRVRPLAVASAQRTKVAPELPTMIEAGVPGFAVTQWHGMLAPAATPRAVSERLYAGIGRALARTEVSTRLAQDGTDAIGSNSQEFAAHLKVEFERWKSVIKKSGLRAE
jgi:tripartite-type tricarboxylate transporter receptor subunit TctC